MSIAARQIGGTEKARRKSAAPRPHRQPGIYIEITPKTLSTELTRITSRQIGAR